MRDHTNFLKGIWFVVHFSIICLAGMLMIECDPIYDIIALFLLFGIGTAGYTLIHKLKYMENKKRDILTVVVVILLAVIGMTVGWMLGEVLFNATN